MFMPPYLSEPLGGAVVLLTLPLVIELAILTFASRLPKRRTGNVSIGKPIELFVLIPAHNEERLISSCVESLRLSASGTRTRIIAIAHNCTDRTAERASLAGADVIVYDDPQAKGKGAALAFGLAHAASQGADACLVVDGDSTVSSNLIRAVGEAISNGAQAVQCRYEMETCFERPKSRLTALAFRGFNVIRPSGRDRLGLSAGIVGNGFALHKALLSKNPYNALSLVEDLEFHIGLVLSGYKVRFLSNAKVSSALPGSKQGESTQRARWEGGRVHAAKNWLLPLFGQLIRGRLRALEPMLDLASLPIGYAAACLFLGLALPLAWLRVYALVAVTVIVSHVLVAAALGNDFAGDMRILSRAPGYILWKLWMVPSLLRSSNSGATWVRTERYPASQVTAFEAAAEAAPANGMERALAISNSLETP